MVDARQLAMENFSLGTPALVCRWRLAAGTLLLANRHMRALARRFVNGHRISPELVAWAKQHIEWTLAEGSFEHPDGVLMLIVDHNGAAAMTVGPYEPLEQRHTRALIARAQGAAQERDETDVAPEVLFALSDGDLLVGMAPDAAPGGCASLVLQLASTLGIPAVFSPDLLDDLLDDQVDAEGVFLASDEHGIVCASDCSDQLCRQFEASYERLFHLAHKPRG